MNLLPFAGIAVTMVAGYKLEEWLWGPVHARLVADRKSKWKGPVAVGVTIALTLLILVVAPITIGAFLGDGHVPRAGGPPVPAGRFAANGVQLALGLGLATAIGAFLIRRVRARRAS